MARIKLFPKETCLEIAKKHAMLEFKLNPEIVNKTAEAELLMYIPNELFGHEHDVNYVEIEYGLTYYYIGDINWGVPKRFVEQVIE